MNRALSAFANLFGAICVLIALAHIVFGPAAIPGSLPVNANMDSEDRFYASMFLGFGLAVIWAWRNIERRKHIFYFLLSIFFIGGIARLISIFLAGWPAPYFLALMAVELTLPLVFWAGMHAARSSLRSGGSEP